jgi:hypothetical protein
MLVYFSDKQRISIHTDDIKQAWRLLIKSCRAEAKNKGCLKSFDGRTREDSLCPTNPASCQSRLCRITKESKQEQQQFFVLTKAARWRHRLIIGCGKKIESARLQRGNRSG